MQTLLLSVAFTLMGHPAQPPAGSDDLQKYAYAIVTGQKGHRRDEEVAVARYVIATGAKVQGKSLVTSFCPPKFKRGARTASGAGCSERTAAVTISEFKHYRGMYFWSKAYGLRVVEDCGANWNLRVARRHGANRWNDAWTPRAMPSAICSYAFISRKAVKGH